MAKWTDEEKAEALRLYVEVGASEAARRTGIPGGSVRVWAMRAGLITAKHEQTRAAVAEAIAVAEAKRERLKATMADAALEMVERMHAPTTVFVGQAGRPERLERPIAGDARNFAVAAAIMVDKLELLSNRATARTESIDAHSDHERSALRAAIERELALQDTERDPHDVTSG